MESAPKRSAEPLWPAGEVLLRRQSKEPFMLDWVWAAHAWVTYQDSGSNRYATFGVRSLNCAATTSPRCRMRAL